jgi:hypothetical protein
MTAATARLASPVSSPSAQPARSANRWHVSPAVDLTGYAFSWMLLAVPVYLVLGADVLRLDEYRAQGIAFTAGAVVLIDVHRNFTFPYVYLDRQRRQAFPLRFWLLPAICLALLSQLPFLAASTRLLYPAECAAIVAWLVVLLQLLRADALGAVVRRRALAGALVALAAGAVLGWAADPHGLSVGTTAGWTWLLGAASASLWVWRTAAAGRAHASATAAWIAPAGMAALIAGAAAFPVILPVSAFVSALGAIYIVWLAYHVLSQKYGILRLYSAKSGCVVQVPRWVDRSLVWSWFPMVLVGSVLQTPDIVVTHVSRVAPGMGELLATPITFVTAHPSLWLTAAAAPIVAAHGAFLYFEWTLHGLRNAPRLAFAAGTATLFASLYLIGVVGLYVAFAATHCIEYLTFVWAIQRQRYPEYDPQAPILSRVVRWPILYYGGIAVVVAAISSFTHYATLYFPDRVGNLYLFGHPIYVWAFWCSIMQAFLHFYYDGFLWKMKPEFLRAL